MEDCHVCICFFILSFWDGRALTSADAIRVKEGENITRGYNFYLYWSITKVSFCREPCGNEDTLVESTGGRAQTGRYSIELEKDKLIYVSITSVSKSDSGLYACAIHRIFHFFDSKQTFEVQVEASVGSTSTTPSTIPEATKPSVKDNQVTGVLLYLCRIVVVVMVTAAAGLILCRKRDGQTPARQVKYSKRSCQQHLPGLVEHSPEVDQVDEGIRDELTCTEHPFDTTSTVNAIPRYPTVTPSEASEERTFISAGGLQDRQ